MTDTSDAPIGTSNLWFDAPIGTSIYSYFIDGLDSIFFTDALGTFRGESELRHGRSHKFTSTKALITSNPGS